MGFFNNFLMQTFIYSKLFRAKRISSSTVSFPGFPFSNGKLRPEIYDSRELPPLFLFFSFLFFFLFERKVDTQIRILCR